MIEFVKEWIEKNDLDVNFITDTYFELGGKTFLILSHKEGKVLNDQFQLIVDDEELEGLESLDNFCFAFGGKVYFSAVMSEKTQLNILKHIGKSKEKEGYPFLGVHGGYELYNGSRVYESWCKKAKFLGISHLGICEKNTLAGALKFQLACKDAKINPIIGMTILVKKGTGVYYHAKVFVKDTEGWQNLLRINRQINVDNPSQYIDESSLLEIVGGIVVVLGNDLALDDATVEAYQEAYKDDVFYQIDPSQYKLTDRDLKKLQMVKTYVNEYRAMLSPILLCDAYYLDKEDGHIKQMLNNISGTLFEHQTVDQSLKSFEETVEQLDAMFTKMNPMTRDLLIGDAYQNLNNAVEKLTFKIEVGTFQLPRYPMTEEEAQQYTTSQDLLWGLLQDGFQRKIENKGKDVELYLQRLQTEMVVIEKGGFESYFLILNDIVEWCKKNDILTGLGRGSAAGSLVSYLLDITKLDPIQYDLLFDRFLNSGRIGKSLPDIDCDFEGERRNEVKRYMEQRHGIENVCSIGTYGTLQSKAAIRSLCRLQGIQSHIVDYHTAMVAESNEELASVFRDAAQAPILKKFLNEYSDVVNNIDLIIGQASTESIHAAGVVITPNHTGKTIFDWIPVKKMDGILVSQWEGPELEKAGYLKEDILGIKQLDKFSAIFKLLKQRGITPPGFEDIHYNDPNVLALFRKGWNQDLFHFGSPGLTSYSQDVKPESMEDLIAMIALYRPGVMEFGAHEDYVKIKQGRKKVSYDWGTEETTKDTYGILVYQEQIMRVCQTLAGFSLAEGDDIRKAMGKKIAEQMEAYKGRFLEGAMAKGCPSHEAMKIWGKLEVFAGYGFNRSHAAAYAMTGYFCQYLKYYYPMEFWTVSLQYAKEKEIPNRLSEIRKFGEITILPPDINKSEKKFVCDLDKKVIYWSLDKIKFAGDVTIENLIEERQKNGQFFSLEELYQRVPKRQMNKRVVVNLILAGCLDIMYNVQHVSERREILKKFYEMIKDEMPDEYNTRDRFFWFGKQREVSGSGYFDYEELINLSAIDSAQQRYATPDQVLSPDNIDCEVVVTGILTEVIPKKSKNGPFAQLVIDHNSEMMEATIWNESWQVYQQNLEKGIGKAIVLSGRVKGADKFKKHNVIHSLSTTEIEIY